MQELFTFLPKITLLEGPKLFSWCPNQNIWIHVTHVFSTWCTVWNL